MNFKYSTNSGIVISFKTLLNDESLRPILMYSAKWFRILILEIRIRSSIGTRGNSWVVSICYFVSGIALVVPIAMPSKMMIGGLSLQLGHVSIILEVANSYILGYNLIKCIYYTDS